jgi:hypothetical protein
MCKLLYRLYKSYTVGRDSLNLTFKNHRTHAAVQLAAVNPTKAWQQAVEDNRNVGNPHLPAFVKALLEMCGVVILAGYGRKRWRLLALLAGVLLAQTASESSSGGGGGGYSGEGEEDEGENYGFGDPDFWSDFSPEERRRHELLDKLSEETPVQEGEEWPTCSCSCGCTSIAAAPWGGLCSNCLSGYHG